MANNYFPTIIQPNIPLKDMTDLEFLILHTVFTSVVDGDKAYFFAEEASNDVVYISREELADALATSNDRDSFLNKLVEDLLLSTEIDEDFDINLTTPGQTYFEILQDIVKRSETLTYITVVSAFYCDKMRPHDFGGAAHVITKDKIRGKSTVDIINDILEEEHL
ncbi:hypothetical protein [Methylocystis sp. ATCC 49242]|uniref:hypothetical protein n=1 Tax=Methylocystis sp. ATCC 49242 TaxID=622637 RepID=UPI0001F87113|nr:hypothetical protein [Methylocystis sp. ATCC 49242]